jgi:hypothetical protein
MSVEELINHITDQNYSKAEITLNDLMSDKMNDALEQEKIAVANQIYNGVDPDEEEDLDDDFEDKNEEEDEDLDDDFEEDEAE